MWELKITTLGKLEKYGCTLHLGAHKLKSNDTPWNWKNVPSFLCPSSAWADTNVMLQYEHIKDFWYITKSPLISLLQCLLCHKELEKTKTCIQTSHTWTWIKNKHQQESHIYTLHCLLPWFCWFYLFDAFWSLCSRAYLFYNIHKTLVVQFKEYQFHMF